MSELCFAAWTNWRWRLYWKRQAQARYRREREEREHMLAINEETDIYEMYLMYERLKKTAAAEEVQYRQ